MDADAGSKRPRVATWIILGVLPYALAYFALAFIPWESALPLVLALAMSGSLLGMALVPAMLPMIPAFGYVALRYWLLPGKLRTWRNTLALPIVMLFQ